MLRSWRTDSWTHPMLQTKRMNIYHAMPMLASTSLAGGMLD